MPTCRQCSQFDGEKCIALGLTERVATRPCIQTIICQYAKIFRGNVLEIGPGVWKYPRRCCYENKNVTWHAVDPNWQDNPKINGYHGTVCTLPFADQYFDWVYALDSMEHWSEFGESPEAGLVSIARVLKPLGILLLTVPIHLHGQDEFVRGDLEAIRRFFGNEWGSVAFYEWRKDYEPLPPALNWKTTKHEAVVQSLGGPSVWNLQILAVRK